MVKSDDELATSNQEGGAGGASSAKQRKRHRVPISCTICRRRKVKCDKKKPQCTNCKKNGVQHLCRYLEPKWAKPLNDEELKYSVTQSVSSLGGTSIMGGSEDSSVAGASDERQDEIDRLKQKIKELEHDYNELRKTSRLPQNDNNGNNGSLGYRALRTNIDTSDLVDCILSSNILFTAKPGPKYQFPIVYQISIFSWMFFVRNDSYLNDLWLKILKLRKHYEYYYSSENAMKDAQKSLENNYTNYDMMNNKIKREDSTGYLEEEEEDAPVESSSKLKKLLEGSFANSNGTNGSNKINNPSSSHAESQLSEKGIDKINKFQFLQKSSSSSLLSKQDSASKCPVLHNSSSMQMPPHPMPPGSGPMKCPVTGQTYNPSDSSGPIEHPHVTLDDKHTYHLVISKCPILHPKESTVSYVMDDNDKSSRKMSNRSNSQTSINLNGKRMSTSASKRAKKLKKVKRSSLANNDDLPNSAASTKANNDENSNNTTTFNNITISNTNSTNNESNDPNNDTNYNMKSRSNSLANNNDTNNDNESNDENEPDEDEDADENGDDNDEDDEEDDDALELNDDFEDPKVCPLMIGDARSLFKEKLARMSLYAMQEELSKTNSPRVTSISAEVTSPTSDSAAKFTLSQPSAANTPGVCPVKHEPMGEADSEANTPIVNKPKLSNTTNGNGLSTGASTPLASSKSSKKVNKKLKTISPSAIKNLNYNNTKQIIQMIEKHLPTRKVVWLLINRYFDKLYIQLPYVDEESFRVRIASIIDSADSTSQKIRLSSIGVEYCEEFLTICLLLIIIRLSWLSLPSKSTNIVTNDEAIMMKPENTINMVLVDMVKEVFSSAKIMSKPSLIIFQVGLYLKNYTILAPEDGFDLDDAYSTSSSTSVLNSNDLPGDLTNESPNMNSPNFMYMLVQLGRTIGLNRDPLNFKNFYSHSDDLYSSARLFRKRHLWRKLWYGLLELSVEANLSLGDYKKGLLIEIDVDPTLGLVNDSWDCRLPGGVEQGILEKSFIGNSLKKEQIVVNNFRDSILVHHLIYKGMSYLFTNDSPPTSREIDNVLSKLYEVISDNSKLLLNPNYFLKPEDTKGPVSLSNKFEKNIKIYKFRMFLLVKSMLFALSYLMFLNHEQKFNGLIAEKTSTIAKLDKQKEYINTYFESSLLLAIDNFNIFDRAFENSEELFGNSGAELILYPYLMVLNHRSHEFLISLILRLQQNSPVIIEILNKNNIEKDELLSRLFNYVETFLDKLDVLTKNYYYAWRLRKLVKFFYNILSNSSKLFKINFSAMNAALDVKDEELSNPMIDTSTPPPPSFRQNSPSRNFGNQYNHAMGSSFNSYSSNTVGSSTTSSSMNYNSGSGHSDANNNRTNNSGNSNTNSHNLQFTTHNDFNGAQAASPPLPPTFAYSPPAKTSQMSPQQHIQSPLSMANSGVSMQQQVPQAGQVQQVVQTPEMEATDEQFNAFAIAFGTSKLPPVTDFNTPKTEFPNNPLVDMTSLNGTNLNPMFYDNGGNNGASHDGLVGGGNSKMINLRQQAHHNNNTTNGQHLPPTPQQQFQHHIQHQQQQQVHAQQLQQAQFAQQQQQQHHQQHQQQQLHQQHSQFQQPPTTPNGTVMTHQQQNQQLAEIFDTKFFSDLHEIQSDINSGNHDMMGGFVGDAGFGNPGAGAGGMMNGNVDGTGNGGFAISYNPLNEIDFTNVDLSSPFDLNANGNGSGKYFNYK